MPIRCRLGVGKLIAQNILFRIVWNPVGPLDTHRMPYEPSRFLAITWLHPNPGSGLRPWSWKFCTLFRNRHIYLKFSSSDNPFSNISILEIKIRSVCTTPFVKWTCYLSLRVFKKMVGKPRTWPHLQQLPHIWGNELPFTWPLRDKKAVYLICFKEVLHTNRVLINHANVCRWKDVVTFSVIIGGVWCE